ncbi:glycoside hydrolase family 97 N-terminal domain-containing protein, partial [Pseudoalteromonas sp. 41-MNA-CIBAN-0057]
DQSSSPYYSISVNGKPVITQSHLGFRFKSQAPFDEGFVISEVTRSQTDSQWQQPWGERQTVVDKHNEIAVTFNKPAPHGGT